MASAAARTSPAAIFAAYKGSTLRAHSASRAGLPADRILSTTYKQPAQRHRPSILSSASILVQRPDPPLIQIQTNFLSFLQALHPPRRALPVKVAHGRLRVRHREAREGVRRVLRQPSALSPGRGEGGDARPGSRRRRRSAPCPPPRPSTAHPRTRAGAARASLPPRGQHQARRERGGGEDAPSSEGASAAGAPDAGGSAHARSSAARRASEGTTRCCAALRPARQ